MQIQSLFQRFHQLAPPTSQNSDGPERIILDTALQVDSLLKITERLPVLSWERDEMVQFIMGLIAYEEKALIELGYSCLEMVSDTMGTDMEQDVEKATSAVTEFGKAIYNQLQRIRAYHNGYLFYQFCGWCGNDVVLARFMVGKDPDKIGVPNDS